jgi:F0F1-type ATP synthase membrane subunit c/vacuolar-type H+-ATPase subunit K
VTTASSVPTTRGELEGDEAYDTLRQTGRRRLVADSATRFRAADGFSHSRALAFQFTLTLLPALIAVVGLAVALGQDDFTRIVRDTIQDLTPGAPGEILTDALRQGSKSAHESGETALVAGGLAALLAGMSAMGQVERGANRIYGVERDRPFLRKYLVGLALALTAGLFALMSLVVLMGRGCDSRRTRLGRDLRLGLAGRALAARAHVRGRVRVPPVRVLTEPPAARGILARLRCGSVSLSAVALFLGLAFAAQLEAVRAGVPEPRREAQAGRRADSSRL